MFFLSSDLSISRLANRPLDFCRKSVRKMFPAS